LENNWRKDFFMAFQNNSRGIPGNLSPLDVMLAEIALRIQLSPTDYSKAVDRYETISDWIDREDSPLCGLVELTYAQGSMAIGATIARCSDRDEFDIDVMAQLGLSRYVDPEVALSLLETSIRGERGSRYYDKTKRNTRCVTVEYADGMHLDVTPAVLLPERLERTSLIFHSKPEDPREPKQRLFANPYGFADWFIARTPADETFAEFFERRSLEEAQFRALAKGESEPVPEQMPAYRKSQAAVTLQLIKRFRNVRYERRPNLRRPPSVLLSKYIADHANFTTTLAEEIMHQASAMLANFEDAHRTGRLVYEENPRCEEDKLTDRWPASFEDQGRFIADLRELIEKLGRLLGGASLREMRKVLEDLFGERPARDVVSDYVERYGRQHGQGRGAHLPGKGQVPATNVMLSAAPAAARRTQRHSFYGDAEE
jgi:hypothetical protein